jgi:hypothetical protein
MGVVSICQFPDPLNGIGDSAMCGIGDRRIMGAGIDMLEQALVSQFAARVGRGKERSD